MPGSWKPGIKFIYERLLSFLGSKAITSYYKQNATPGDELDFTRPPTGNDRSGANLLCESIRYLGRSMGETDFRESHFYSLMVKWDMLSSIKNDLRADAEISDVEVDALSLAVNTIAKAAGTDMSNKTTNKSKVSVSQLDSILATVDEVKELIAKLDYRATVPPLFRLTSDTRLKDICDASWFGRLRRDFDVDTLAGNAPIPPIMRPIEMTLVPDSVYDFQDVIIAMRHTLNLCVLLANQHKIVRNSYTLRLCLIEHLFVRVIPLPLPMMHKDRDAKCFWHSQPIRFETQAEILRLLNMISRHFAISSLSVKITRSGDAIRMLVFSCFATIGDAVLRKIATDVPAYPSLHYSGRALGPLQPFGFELGNFSEESEYLKFCSPEATTARTQVLDYFYDMKKLVPDSHMMFKFETSNEICAADKMFVDQLCLNLGFKRGQAIQYLTAINPVILDHYPEIAYFRDLVFMFKLVMVPTSDRLPELKQWEPEDFGLKWKIDDDINYKVKGFGMTLDCVQEKLTGSPRNIPGEKSRLDFFMRFVGMGAKSPRSLPSQANPTIILGQRVETEDDVLHIRELPNFDNTLGARDCELLLQYLTAPYIRIPLLLNFFSVEGRLQALRSSDLQEVLDAALFEPGAFKTVDGVDTPLQVPARTRDHLLTPVGLLFNEIIMSPQVILAAVQSMLEKVIDMDTGRYSELGASILYVVRLAVRVEGFLLFLVKNRKFRQEQKASNNTDMSGAYQHAYVRGLECAEVVIQDALACQKAIRQILDEKVFLIIARWIIKSKKDALIGQACMLHAHLAYIYRDIEPEDLKPKVIFTSLACQIYLFNNFRYDIDVEATDGTKKNRKEADQEVATDLIIPQVEVFSMFQRNRRKILTWLESNPTACNTVMDGILQMVEGDMAGLADSDNVIAQQWKTIHRDNFVAFTFAGRFMPAKEVDEEMIDRQLSIRDNQSYESWLVQVSTTMIETEINVQLGEFTIKKNAIQLLPEFFKNFEEFDTVFHRIKSKNVLQCAVIEQRQYRMWVRLIGLGYDLQAWVADTRRPTTPHNRPVFPIIRTEGNKMPNLSYLRDLVDYTNYTSWLREILDPWREKLFPNAPLLMTTYPTEKDDSCLLVYYVAGSDPSVAETLKEIIVYRYPKVIHVFNVTEYGRRWYRTQIFSSDNVFTFHEMRMAISMVGDKSVETSGTVVQDNPASSSLVIHRYATVHSPVKQTFLPTRLLYGLLPDILITPYKFWQNEDDSLVGFMPFSSSKSLARSILHVKVAKRGHDDTSGFCNSLATAVVSRTFVQEDPALEPEDAEFNTHIDSTKPELYLVNLMAVMASYRTTASEESKKFMDATLQGYKSLVSSSTEPTTVHALIRMLMVLDTFSNIVAWSKTKPEDNPKEKVHIPISIDLIELPRLRLTFEKKQDREGKVIYTCLDHAGLYIAGYEPKLKFAPLLDGIPRVLLLKNADDEYFALIPSIAKPALLAAKTSKQFFFTTSMSNQEWITNSGEGTNFIYPIHASGVFMASKSIASSLYLLLIRLMTRKYEEAYGLLEACISDIPFTVQEKQIYDQIATIKDFINPDLHAFRLKLFVLTFGCNDVMPFQFNAEEEYYEYVTKLRFISAACRLSPQEESFVLSRLPANSDVRRILPVMNRENIIKVTFDLGPGAASSPDPRRTFTAAYPLVHELKDCNADKIDVALLDTDQPSALAFLKKLVSSSYTKPETSWGPPVIKQVLKFSEKSASFLLLYELLANQVQLQVIQSDTPYDLGVFLFYFTGNDGISGVQNLILKIMSFYPTIATMMPTFEDKRRLKLPKFTGLDPYQAHIKSAAAYIQENLITEKIFSIQELLAQYRPLGALQAEQTIEKSVDLTEGRFWLSPQVRDFKGLRRTVSHTMVPPSLTALSSYLTSKEVTYLVGTPLHSIDLRKFIDLKNLKSRNLETVDSKFPIDVLRHPSSQSYIARVSVSRLDQDLKDFAHDENALLTPVLKNINNTINFEGDAIQKAIDLVVSLISSLDTLRNNDNIVVKVGIEEIVNYANGIFAADSGNLKALRHNLLQRAKSESTLVSVYVNVLYKYDVLVHIVVYLHVRLFVCLYVYLYNLSASLWSRGFVHSHLCSASHAIPNPALAISWFLTLIIQSLCLE